VARLRSTLIHHATHPYLRTSSSVSSLISSSTGTELSIPNSSYSQKIFLPTKTPPSVLTARVTPMVSPKVDSSERTIYAAWQKTLSTMCVWLSSISMVTKPFGQVGGRGVPVGTLCAAFFTGIYIMPRGNAALDRN
jgi:hypothetical protein